MKDVLLPMPPSVNKAYRTASKAEVLRGSRGRIKTTDYTAWATQAGYMLNAAHVDPVASPVAISIYIGQCNEGRDADNFAKLICDLLVKHKVIVDDSLRHVHWVSVQKAFETVPAGMVSVSVTHLDV